MAENEIVELSLGGRTWQIPLLAIKQNRIVVPALMKLMPVLGKMYAISQAIKAGGNSSAAAAAMADGEFSISTEQFDLIATAVYTAITRGTPGFARAEFDDLPITVEELMMALPIIAKQTGMMKGEKDKGDASGEAPAGGSPPS